MSPTGGWYIFWHPDRPGEIQEIQATNLPLARQVCVFPKDHALKHYAAGPQKPDKLMQVAAIEGDLSLVDKAVKHWPETDASQKPVSRARICFIFAFDRTYHRHEALALSDIVSRARERFGEDIPDEDTVELPPGEEEEEGEQPEQEEIEDATNEDEVRGEDTPEDTRAERNHGVRLGTPAWANEVRPVKKDERDKKMEARGDPRGPRFDQHAEGSGEEDLPGDV